MEKLFGLEMATIAGARSAVLAMLFVGLAPTGVFEVRLTSHSAPPGAVHLDRHRTDAGNIDHHRRFCDWRHPLAHDAHTGDRGDGRNR